MDSFRKSREIRRLSSELGNIDNKINLIDGIRTKVNGDQPLLKKQQALILPEIASVIDHRKFLLPTIPEPATLEYAAKTKQLRRLKRKIGNKAGLTGIEKELLEEVLKSLEDYLKMQRSKAQSELKKLMSTEGSTFSAKFSCSCVLAAVIILWVSNLVLF